MQLFLAVAASLPAILLGCCMPKEFMASYVDTEGDVKEVTVSEKSIMTTNAVKRFTELYDFGEGKTFAIFNENYCIDIHNVPRELLTRCVPADAKTETTPDEFKDTPGVMTKSFHYDNNPNSTITLTLSKDCFPLKSDYKRINGYERTLTWSKIDKHEVPNYVMTFDISTCKIKHG